MAYRLDDTWCCLNEGERSLIDAILFEYEINSEYITLEEFNALALLTIFVGQAVRSQIVIWSFDLYPGVVTLPVIGDIDVLFFGSVFWPEIEAYSMNPGLQCAELCSILTYSA